MKASGAARASAISVRVIALNPASALKPLAANRGCSLSATHNCFVFNGPIPSSTFNAFHKCNLNIQVHDFEGIVLDGPASRETRPRSIPAVPAASPSLTDTSWQALAARPQNEIDHHAERQNNQEAYRVSDEKSSPLRSFRCITQSDGLAPCSQLVREPRQPKSKCCHRRQNQTPANR